MEVDNNISLILGDLQDKHLRPHPIQLSNINIILIIYIRIYSIVLFEKIVDYPN
jgi:hypothetical protein